MVSKTQNPFKPFKLPNDPSQDAIYYVVKVKYRCLGWRPTFKFYNQWVSLFGALLCVVVMFIMSWYTALITMIIFVAIFVYILHRKPGRYYRSYVDDPV
jgi:hypothetical protein